jgi:hypothetical protein
MPTGYTEKLYEGDQEFEPFVLRCARAFGALVEMRDTGLDAAIPDEIVPTPYHQIELDEAILRLRNVRALDADTCQQEASAAHRTWQEQEAKTRAETEARRSRYTAMRELVLAWHPPTDDHTPLRDFMVEQLDESIRFDCGPYYASPEPPLDGATWRAEAIAKAERDIAYHERERAADRVRSAERTAWIKDLRRSLGGVAAPHG